MNEPVRYILKTVMRMKKWKTVCCGAGIGFCNALFGAGGGLLAVPYFKACGLRQKTAQALSLAVTLPLSALSAFVYLRRGYVTLSDALRFVLPGLLGAAAGTLLLKKSPDRVLHGVFALLLCWAGVRMLAG